MTCSPTGREERIKPACITNGSGSMVRAAPGVSYSRRQLLALGREGRRRSERAATRCFRRWIRDDGARVKSCSEAGNEDHKKEPAHRVTACTVHGGSSCIYLASESFVLLRSEGTQTRKRSRILPRQILPTKLDLGFVLPLAL